MRYYVLPVFIALILCVAGNSGYSEDKGGDSDNPPKKEASEDDQKEKISRTTHSVKIGGKKIGYTATAGTLLLKKEDDKPEASMFYVAYTKDNAKDLGTRPVTFSFNGGPGSSSVWLHLGVLGPRRVDLNDDGTASPPPYRLVDNEYSLLDKTDLIFIDPVSTGYSRAVPGKDPKKFHGLEKDLESVGEFIRLYITRNRRWSSPKFLIGESYGSMRAAGLAEHLHNRHGMYLNGIMLVSSVIDFQTIRFDRSNNLPYILFLPTYASTAWYHKKLANDLPTDLTDLLAEVEAFALGDYATALLSGASITDDVRNEIASKVSRYTGLSREYVERSNLRINIFRFVKELLRDEKRTIGRFDSRIVGHDRDSAGESPEYDPSYEEVRGPLSATLNDYLRTELEFESDLPYEILTGKVHPWRYDKFKNRYVEVSERLRRTMNKNPSLKVLICAGYFDLATPHLAAVYSANHLAWNPKVRDNISLKFYEGGHMMYFHKPSLIKMKYDLEEFIDNAVSE